MKHHVVDVKGCKKILCISDAMQIIFSDYRGAWGICVPTVMQRLDFTTMEQRIIHSASFIHASNAIWIFYVPVHAYTGCHGTS
jgi:hypothetical protein